MIISKYFHFLGDYNYLLKNAIIRYAVQNGGLNNRQQHTQTNIYFQKNHVRLFETSLGLIENSKK